MGKAIRSKIKSRQKETVSRPTKITNTADSLNDKDTKIEVAKKDTKKKQRHEAWLEKLDHSYAVKKQQKKKESKKKSNHGIDLSGIGDILKTIQFKPKSTLVDMATEDTTKRELVTPTNKIKSKKAKKQSEMQEILRMQKLMQHGQFKQNPLSTIHQHVQNTFQ